MSTKIRNFCIIAHIDHGKSTLADRFLEITGTIAGRDMCAQTLDTMELEKERGITIKLTPVRMQWHGHELNLIDTPGHVDFQYEVSRSLASVEGAVLVVDASQGIEAQTLSNVYLALEHGLEIIPVMNKIDLPNADVEGTREEIVALLGCDPDSIIPVSAKTGENVASVLDAVIERIPEPRRLDATGTPVSADLVKESSPCVKALIFDSQYDVYKGVVIYVKLFSGTIRRGDTLDFLHTGVRIEVLEVGYFAPRYHPIDTLQEGEIGYIVTGLRAVAEAQVGDTVYRGPTDLRLPIEGFRRIQPFIFAGIYPMDTTEYDKLKDSIAKLSLNDSALVIEHEVSPALGHGFRCGFLGLLHLDIIRERLWREHSMDVIMTSPQVPYRVYVSGDHVADYPRLSPALAECQGRTATMITVSNPEDLPPPGTHIEIEEPIARVEMLTPTEYIGNCMSLAQDHRGIFLNQSHLDARRVILSYEIPMAEIVTDFYDDLKSLTSGYGSLHYELLKYKADDLVRLDILVAGERIDAFSVITHRSKTRTAGGEICRRLKEHIPRAQFGIAIQAAIGSTVVAREDLGALRKDVTAKLYGGDVSRKRKLLDKQKEGKKKMRQFGKVSIPSETFVKILKKQ